jgi:hypothetical protein
LVHARIGADEPSETVGARNCDKSPDSLAANCLGRKS